MRAGSKLTPPRDNTVSQEASSEGRRKAPVRRSQQARLDASLKQKREVARTLEQELELINERVQSAELDLQALIPVEEKGSPPTSHIQSLDVRCSCPLIAESDERQEQAAVAIQTQARGKQVTKRHMWGSAVRLLLSYYNGRGVE